MYSLSRVGNLSNTHSALEILQLKKKKKKKSALCGHDIIVINIIVNFEFI
jgi:hypothetical protein